MLQRPPPLMATALLFLLLLPGATYAAVRSTESLAEVNALTAFKLNLRDPLGALTGWNASTPKAPCDWRGVVCYEGLVIDVGLPRLQLAGELSDRIGDLRMLRRLSLRSNNFNGSIPSSLAKCSLLQYVYLLENSFSGKILPEISNLKELLIFSVAGNNISGEVPSNLPSKLRYLDLSSNLLSGELPMNVADLPDLQLLNLSYNRFTGAIPARYGALQKLQYLGLDHNRLEGTLPSAIANCSSLVHFSADGNAIRGVIPAGIGYIPKLQVISLSNNNLTGPIPASIFCNIFAYPPTIKSVNLGFNAFTDIESPETASCFSFLQVLDLQNNQIQGVFPLWLSNLSTLTALDFSGNDFSGEMPSEIGNLWRLEELNLGNNSLTGVVPIEIKKLLSLRVLNLEGNLFTGEIPPFLSDLTGLNMLYLGGNQFKGNIPASFTNLTQLETLSLRDNNLTGTLPEELMSMSNLTSLNLAGNKFSGEIPVTIGNLQGLSVLNLSGNELSGIIPASVGTLYKLTTLDLSKQSLTGELPSDLSGLPNLQVISLQQNKLFGDLPEGFSSLLGLRYLNLSSNSFSGHIPSTFSFLKSLAVLSLSNNNISGQIPLEIGNYSDIEILDVSSNFLTGEIPVDISRLTHLTQLNLSKNNLTGKIPEQFSGIQSLTSLLLNSNHLSGLIPDSLSNLPNLTSLNLSSNNLTGKIPETLASRFNNESSFVHNNHLCGKPLERKCKNISSGNKNRMILLIAVAATGACFMVICFCFYTYGLFKWRKRLKERSKSGEKKRMSPHRSSGTRSSSENGSPNPKLVMFNNKITLAETLEATKQFDEENVLSRTQFGVIFKACYNDGMVLSVRRFSNGSLDENMFRKEAESLGKIRHRNLTVLRGYYAGPPDLRLLVYDYMPNGNLATLLQEASHQEGHVLNWPMRHLIALGVARGLAFLHSTATVHGDFKPQNVLFDADFEAHVSEFGLGSFSALSSGGTPGYVSPDSSGILPESDVYSFGIVLLELLTGKRPVMFTGQDEDIVKWVKRQLQTGRVSELLEPGLLELDPESSEWEEFLLGVKVGLLCTAPDSLTRPTMADVVFMLEGCRVGPDTGSSADPTAQPSPM